MHPPARLIPGSGALQIPSIKVQLAVDTGGREFAVKTMRKVRGLATREASLRKIKREARLMRMAQSCQGVVQLVDCFEEAEFVHLVTEVCRGGDLKKHVEAHGPLSERMLAHTACEVLKIVRDMHALGIVYADVKPANFCLADEWVESASGDSVADSAAGEVGWRIKAIDFGCSQLFGPEAGRSPRLSKRTGTLAFMAPEIFDHDFSAKADVWSTGVSLYWLFTGRLPYWGEGEVPNLSRVDDMAALARGAPMALDYGPWLSMSEEGTSFITGCLTRSESDRLDVDAALAHPWIAKRAPRFRQ
ncbi:hypothetical protein FOA52_013630 [Chlamydomonas sp. UWO 241]|nr:hypothetical protein FOA52_013630 [Chlamydomonas sp. UWO 241]